MAGPDLGFDIIEPEIKADQRDAGYDVIEPENAQPTPSESFEVIEPDKQYLSQIKRDYVSQGGNPLDVYAPERANLLTTEFNKNLEAGLSQEDAMLKATDALEAMPPETRPDGSISAGYLPTEEAIQKGMIQPAALPAVRKAMDEGVLTISSGFDKEKGVGFAVGKAKDGRVLRIEEKPPTLLGASLRSVGEQIIPGASAVAGTILGGVAGAPAGPVGILAGGLAGGAAGYKAGEMGQAGLARILAGEQGYADYQRMREADIAMFPITTKSLEIATPMVVGAGLAGPTRAIDKFQQLLQPKAVSSLQAKPQPSEVIGTIEGQQPIRPGVVGEAGFESGTARPEFKMPEVPEGSKIARTAERVLKSEKTPEPFKAEVALQPSTVRANVPLGAIKGNLEDLTDDELNVIARRSITSSAYDDAERTGANAILAARQIDADPASAAINWDEFTKAASLAGVSLRNVREYLNTPTGYLATISKAAEAAKRNIPKSVQDTVLRLFNASKNAKAELVKAEATYRSKDTGLTEETAVIAENARKAAASAATKLQRYSDSIFPKKILGETLPQGIQITLLSPLSLVKNPIFNVARAVGQLGVRSLANAGDAVLSFVAKQKAVLGGKTPEEITKAGQRTMAQSALTTRGAMIRGTEKTKEAIRAFLGEGIPASSALAGEGVKGFTVFKSLAQAFTGKDMVTNAKGNIALIDRVRKLAEGIIGSYTEPVGRVLTLGDVPARGFAEGRLLAEQAILAGKSPKQVLASVRFPTKTELKGISNKAAEATFQQDTKLTTVVGVVANAVKSIPIVGPLTKAVIAPYTRTPVNVVTDVVDVAVPGLAFSKSAYYAAKGDRRKSLEAAAKGIVGTVIGGTAAGLYRAGVITGSASKSAKERGIQYETQPPNTINMSGLKRLLNGEDPAIQAGDEIKSYENFGYLGTIFNVYANVLSKNEGSGLLEDVLDVTLKGLPSVASYTLNQTFLKSTNTLLNAISKEDYDSYLESLYGTISSIPFPNTLQAFNKASRENMVDPKTDDSLQLFANVLKSKMPEFAREAIGAEELPLKRDMWGNPVKQTPEGANPFLYNFLDFTRSRIVPSDESNLALYRLWKETGNADALPSVPSRNVMDKKITYQLDENQYAIYQEYVGQRRKALVDNLFQSATFDGMDADFKIKALGKAYERGAEDGKRQFLKYNKDYLTPKEK
jgi:hypothetical protein